MPSNAPQMLSNVPTCAQILSESLGFPPCEKGRSSPRALFSWLASAPKCSQMLSNVSKWLQMLQNALECSQMLSNAPKCLKCSQKCAQMFASIRKPLQMAPDALKCSQMLSNALGKSGIPSVQKSALLVTSIIQLAS